MTKLLVIGNSHSGALKSASENFSQVYPEVELSFFAAPGALFKQGRVKKDGRFHPRINSEKERALVRAINGVESIDLSAFDQLLVIGHRPDLLQFRSLAKTYGRLEGSKAEQDANFLISEEALNAWMNKVLNAWAQKVTSRFRGRPNVTVTDAPYRSTSLLELAKTREEAARFQLFLSVPYVAELMAQHDRLIGAHLQENGLTYLAQPAHTVAGPYATKADYCQNAVGPDGADVRLDHRHMNAEFGYEVLQAYVSEKLGLPKRKWNNAATAKAFV